MTPEFVYAVQEALRTATPAVRATLIRAQGFVPVPRNSSMLLYNSGSVFGSLGQEDLEHAVQEAARHILRTGQWAVQQFTVTPPAGTEVGWYNGWVVDVLLEPLTPAEHSLWQALYALLDTGKRGLLGTVLSPTAPGAAPRKMLLGYDGSHDGALDDTALEAHLTRRGQDIWQGEENLLEDVNRTDGSTVQLFLEPLVPHPTLYVFGGGRIAPPLVHMAALAGFRPIVIDHQAEFANATLFPDAKATLVMEFAAVGRTFNFGPDDYLVLMTRGHHYDEQILEQIYACSARYLGLLGSSRRAAAMWQRLEAQGVARHYLDRIHAPIGLSIGAVSPEEVALSIVTEMVQERRTGRTVLAAL